MSFNIGDTSKLRLKDGITGPLTEDHYTITANLTIQELINLNVPVYENVFKPFGFDEEEYGAISRTSVVYGVMSIDNKTTYVSEDVIEVVKEAPTVAYESKVLAISLGEHPQYREFTALKQYLTDAVSEYLGITPSITLLSTSDVIRITEERHQYISNLRTTVSNTIRTPSRRLIQRENELEFLMQENTGLKKFIQEYLTTCATNCNPDDVVEEDDPVSNTTIDKAHFSFAMSSHNRMRAPCSSTS